MQPELQKVRAGGAVHRQSGGIFVADGGSGSAYVYLLAETGRTDGQEIVQVLREEGGHRAPDRVAGRDPVR